MPESKRPPAAVAKSAKPPPPSKRRIVNLADDADEVLAQCRKLRDALRRKQTKQANDGGDEDPSEDEWGDDSHDGEGKGKGGGKKKKTSVAVVKTDVDAEEGDPKKAKTQQLSLSELKSISNAAGGRKSIVEVVEMNSTEVMEGIENVAVTIAQQVLARQGFQLDIPCELFLTIRSCEHHCCHSHDDVKADLLVHPGQLVLRRTKFMSRSWIGSC
jgi:hypothetical protein